jgi:hypothetical protein
VISSQAKTFQSHKSRSCGESGVALVLTLLIISMLVVVVVGFTVSTRTEQIAARNANYKILAEQLARDGTGRALQKLGSGFVTTDDDEEVVLIATQPGRVSRKGKPAVNLFSSGVTTDINTVTSPAWITGVPSDNIGAGWEEVLDSKNKAVGRVAYYVDDESAKLPLNAASPTRNSLNPASTRPFSFAALIQSGAATAADRDSFGAVVNGTFGTSSISNWTYFFVPEQARGSVFRSTLISSVSLGLSNWFRIASRFSVAAPSVIDSVGPPPKPQTPWGTDKVLINQLPLADASVTELANAMRHTRLTKVFGGHFGDKYGDDGVEQLAANMLQLRSDHWAGGAKFTGSAPILGTSDLTGPVAAPPESGMLKKTNGIPPNYFGYVPFPMLSEIDVSLMYGWIDPTADVMTIRVVLTCVVTNPYNVPYPGGGQLYAQIDKASFAIRWLNDGDLEEFRGPDGSPQHNDIKNNNYWGNAGQAALWDVQPLDGIRTSPIPKIDPSSSEELTLSFDIVFDEANPLARLDRGWVIIDQIKLLATPGDPKSIRDWCSGNDFFNALSADGNEPAQFEFAPLPPDLAQPLSDFVDRPGFPEVPPPLMKLVRMDPRMKPSLAMSAIYKSEPPGKSWSYVTYGSPPLGPTDFENAKIPADPAFANDLSMAVYNTVLPPAPALPSGNYSMAADLGKVFTGMPWRTLRMQPQPANEVDAGLIPDWVLLDMIDFGLGGQDFISVNPNIGYVSAAGTNAGFGAGMRSLMDSLTNASTIQDLADPMNIQAPPVKEALPVTVRENVEVTQEVLSNLLTALSRPEVPMNWASPDNGWRKRRVELGFSPGAIFLASELAEINGFANYNPNPDEFKFNEYRLGALFPGMATKSRFFKIYAVGEAFEGATQNVAARALLQTLVEVNDSTTPFTVRTVYQYPPAD